MYTRAHYCNIITNRDLIMATFMKWYMESASSRVHYRQGEQLTGKELGKQIHENYVMLWLDNIVSTTVVMCTCIRQSLPLIQINENV